MLSPFAHSENGSLTHGTGLEVGPDPQIEVIVAKLSQDALDIGLSEELINRLKKQRSADFVIIDSFQYTGWDFKKYLAFKKAIARKKMIIIISQTKGNMPLGRTALSVQFDACMKIWVEGFKAFSKGRFLGNNGGEYIINEEKSQRYAESI